MDTVWRWTDGKSSSIELRGEKCPLSAAVSADGSIPAASQYEYVWSICFPPHEPGSGFLDIPVLRRHELAQPALQVVLMFVIDPRWRVVENAAAVRHLAPFRTETAWRQRLADDWNALAPVLGVVGGVVADAAGQPELAPVARRIASVKATSVPPSEQEESNWFVRSVHTNCNGTQYVGVEWVLGRELLGEIGERVTGSLLVQFEETETDPADAVKVTSAGAICQATVHLQHQKDIRMPPWPADDRPNYLDCAVTPAADTRS